MTGKMREAAACPGRISMPVIDVHGQRIAYRRQGTGPAMLLLHSVLTDSRVWSRQMEGLSDEFTMVAWDAPGSGQSADPPANATIADYVETLAGFIDAVGLDHPHLVGAAWGTVLAFEFSRAYPDVPRSLVLASAYAGWSGSLPVEEVNRRVNRIREESQLPPDAFVASWIPTLVSPTAAPEVITELAGIMREMRPTGVTSMTEAFARVDSRDILPRIAVPTLLIYGEGDRRAPVHIGHELHAQIAGSQLKVIPGAAHMVYLEAGDAVNAEIRGFLSGKGAKGKGQSAKGPETNP
jgi:pimeloyl-ACP methyl ester carboxylesterase